MFKKLLLFLLVIGLVVSFYALLVTYRMYSSLKVVQKTSPVETSLPTVTPYPSVDENQLWDDVETWRKESNLSTYTKDQRLCTIAEDRSHDPDDDHQTFYKKYSSYPYVLQENAIYYTLSAEKALDGWIHSPAHLATLKKSYKYSCIQCSDQTCIQIFSNF